MGRVLLPGESLPEPCDFAVLCHGKRDASADFDWLSGYLPYADANGVVLSAPVMSCTAGAAAPLPVLAGLCGSDPFREHGQMLRGLKAKGFSGVCNYPSVGLMDGSFRTIVEQQGLGFEQEVRLIRIARSMGLYTLALVFSSGEAQAMLEAGADALLLHPGLACCPPSGLSPGSLPVLDSYQRDLATLANRLPGDCLLFAVCNGPCLDGEMARSLLPVSGFYATGRAWA